MTSIRKRKLDSDHSNPDGNIVEITETEQNKKNKKTKSVSGIKKKKDDDSNSQKIKELNVSSSIIKSTAQSMIESKEFIQFHQEVIRLLRGPKPPYGGKYDPSRNICIQSTKKWVLIFDKDTRHMTSSHSLVRICIQTGNLFLPCGKVAQGNLYTAPHHGCDLLSDSGHLTTKQRRTSATMLIRDINIWKAHMINHPDAIPPLYIQHVINQR